MIIYLQGEPRRLASTKSHEDKKAIARKIQEIQYSQVALLIVALDIRKQYVFYTFYFFI